jgi:hypothetical protein
VYSAICLIGPNQGDATTVPTFGSACDPTDNFPPFESDAEQLELSAPCS